MKVPQAEPLTTTYTLPWSYEIEIAVKAENIRTKVSLGDKFRERFPFMELTYRGDTPLYTLDVTDDTMEIHEEIRRTIVDHIEPFDKERVYEIDGVKLPATLKRFNKLHKVYFVDRYGGVHYDHNGRRFSSGEVCEFQDPNKKPKQCHHI
jgi:hypothetical protein